MCTKLENKELWSWFIHQDQIIMTQFGVGIVGIGTLLFAYGSLCDYGSVHLLVLKAIIAIIGLGGSFILLMHIYGSRKEIDGIIGVLKSKSSNDDFFKNFDEIKRWRKTDSWYIPVTQLMQYFMVLVIIAWIVILVFPALSLFFQS